MIRTLFIIALMSIIGTLGSQAQSSLDDFNLAPLSSDDVETYRNIFYEQNRGRWKQADAEIKKIANPILMGHVWYQRYMHATAYTSKFSELKAWMEDYGDLPGSQRIYDLAKRKNGGKTGGMMQPMTGGSYAFHGSHSTWWMELAVMAVRSMLHLPIGPKIVSTFKVVSIDQDLRDRLLHVICCAIEGEFTAPPKTKSKSKGTPMLLVDDARLRTCHLHLQSILRKGKYIDTVDVESTTLEVMSELMVGRKVNLKVDKEPASPMDVVLSVKNLTVKAKRSNKNKLTNVSFEAKRGEIVCIAGIDGNG